MATSVAIPSLGANLDLEQVAEVIPPPPPIVHTSAPAYIPLANAPIDPEPMPLPPPTGQQLGEGGTPHAVTSGADHVPVYTTFPVLYAPRGDGTQAGYWYNSATGEFSRGTQADGPPNASPGWLWFAGTGTDTFDPYAPPPVLKWDQQGAVPNNPELAPRRGDKQTMPVPTGQQPTRPPVGEAIPESTPPKGPVTGKVGGFDLSAVPLWAWLAGAALLGARLLK